MFSSINYQRWLKWVQSPKKYIVNLEVKIHDRYSFLDVEVIAHNKSDAIEKAKLKANDNIKVIFKGLKSLGKIHKLNEF